MSDSDDDILASLELPDTFNPSQSSNSVPSETKKAKLTDESDCNISDSVLANLTIPSPSKNPIGLPSTSAAAAAQPVMPAAPAPRTINKANCVLVHPKQRGNPILKSITNVPWEFEDGILADYVVGVTAGILFLSLRYHQLNPDYIHGRLKDLGKRYELRVLLVQVDTKVWLNTHNFKFQSSKFSMYSL